ncbi:MAG: ATP-binding protein [Cyanobacteria bacterium J06598_3]
MQTLMAAIAISLILVAAGNVHTARISRSFQSSVATDFQLQQLSGTVTYLDEVRTMSARMAATTGDLSWETRYKAYAPVLVEAINQAIALAPEAYNIHARQIDETNLKLIEIEYEAFDLVRQKKLDQALAKLFDDEYTTQKGLYATGLQLWTQFLDSKVKSDLQRYDQGLFWAGVFSMTSFWLLMLAWASLLYGINQYIRRRAGTERKLRKAQRQLDINQHESQRATTQIQQKEALLETTRIALKQNRDRLVQSAPFARFGKVVSGALQTMALEAAEANDNMAGDHGTDETPDPGEALLRSLSTFANSKTTATDIDIPASLDNTLSLLQHRLQGTPERIEITLDRQYEDLPTIQGYAASLNQVFLNLLTNAIDTLDEAGRSPSTPGQHQITLNAATFTDPFDVQWIKITIADTGQGIPYDSQDLFFDPFFTTKPTDKPTNNPTDKSTGQKSGVGLTTSYSIITEQHEGKFTVTSTPGQGSEFVIQLPVALKVELPRPVLESSVLVSH